VTSVVLCSGGLDSTTIATDLIAREEAVELCFVDFGQPAVQAERRSVEKLCERLNMSRVEVGVAGLAMPAVGEIAARNLLLISITAALRPQAEMIFIGIHAGTGYRDCSPAFVKLMQQVLDFHTDGTCQLVAPFVDWSKGDVVAFARQLDMPLNLTHSCETSDVPCGKCRSCIDRSVLLVG
jgi:7-cyano-7-deazaguanine synthase